MCSEPTVPRAQVERNRRGDRRGRGRRPQGAGSAACPRTCATLTTRALRSSGTARGYAYPHDLPGGVAAQQYLPDELVDRVYYRPSRHGAEAAWGDIDARLRELRRDDDR